MNIYWEERDYSGSEKEPEFKKAGDKIDGSVDLTQALMGDTQTAYVTFIEQPTHVGGYDITGGNGGANSIVFNFIKKPNWFRRTCTKFFLGWRWNDKK